MTVLLMLLLLGLSGLWIRHHYVHKDLDMAKLEVSLLKSQIEERMSDLAACNESIEVQNAAIDALQEERVLMEARLSSARQDIELSRGALNEALDRLQTQTGETCDEGIELIDVTLGLQ